MLTTCVSAPGVSSLPSDRRVDTRAAPGQDGADTEEDRRVQQADVIDELGVEGPQDKDQLDKPLERQRSIVGHEVAPQRIPHHGPRRPPPAVGRSR